MYPAANLPPRSAADLRPRFAGHARAQQRDQLPQGGQADQHVDRARQRRILAAESDVFHLRDADLDRPITETTARVPYPQLEDDVKPVLASLGMVERMLEGGPGDSVYLLRMRPYRTTENVIDGVVLALIDITERRRTAWMLRESERRLTSIVKQTTVGVAETELSGTLVMVNPRFAEILGTTADDLLGGAWTISPIPTMPRRPGAASRKAWPAAAPTRPTRSMGGAMGARSGPATTPR